MQVADSTSAFFSFPLLPVTHGIFRKSVTTKSILYKHANYTNHQHDYTFIFQCMNSIKLALQTYYDQNMDNILSINKIQLNKFDNLIGLIK